MAKKNEYEILYIFSHLYSSQQILHMGENIPNNLNKDEDV